MKMTCCGVVYSTDDPSTYWCMQKYINKIMTKAYVNDNRVSKEVVYSVLCKKNGCTKIMILRYGSLEENLLLERETLHGKKAMIYLHKTRNIRMAVPQKCPLQIVPISKRIPYVYGKAINSVTQGIRYLNEEGWAPRGLIHSPLKVYKI